MKPPKRKPNLFVRFLLFLSSLILVLTAMAVVIFRDQINIDALRRWFTYRSLSLNDSGQAESFHYNGSSGDVFADLDGDLLVCGSNHISLYSGSGVQYVDQAVDLASPAAHVGGGAAVVYDAGGTSLYIFRQRDLAFSMRSEGTLLSARLNSSGLLTVVTQQSGFRGVVTVYDGDFQPTCAVRLSSAYVMDAQLADDGKTLAVVTISQEGGDFTSSLLLYDLSAAGKDDVSYDAVPAASCSLGGSVVLELREHGGGLWALGDRGLSVLDSQAALLGSLNWSDRFLKAWSLGGEGFAVALLGKYRAGSQGSLVVVDSTGATVGALPLDEQVLSVHAAGRYFAVLTADRLDVYTQDMTLYSTLTDTQGARKVLMRDDGSAILISAGSARLYIPA